MRYQPPPATKDVTGQFGELARVLDAREPPGAYAPSLAAIVQVGAGETRRLAPRSSGQTAVLPASDQTNVNAVVTLIVEDARGTLTVTPTTGTINGASSVAFTSGTYVVTLLSCGQGRWAMAKTSATDLDTLAGAGLARNGAALDVQVGNALSIVSDAVALTGSVTNVNSSSTSGDLNVVDISAVSCGGTASFQSVTEANIDGFTAKTDGFWFVLYIRDATTVETVTLTDNTGDTTTSIRTPDQRDWRLQKNEAVMLMYSNSRWRTVSSRAIPWLTPADSVTWAAQQDNFGGSSRGTQVIRVTLTGAQTLTGIFPDGSVSGGRLVLIENIDTVDTLTIAHDATSTAANRFLCPGGVNYAQGPLTSTLWRYDSVSSRWRMVSHS